MALMADKMWFNYNTAISMFNKGGYVTYVALIIILRRIAKKCKPSRVLMISTQSQHPCHLLFFPRDHLRSNLGIISCPWSFAVQFGDHLRSRIICSPGIICGPVQNSNMRGTGILVLFIFELLLPPSSTLSRNFCSA